MLVNDFTMFLNELTMLLMSFRCVLRFFLLMILHVKITKQPYISHTLKTYLFSVSFVYLLRLFDCVFGVFPLLCQPFNVGREMVAVCQWGVWGWDEVCVCTRSLPGGMGRGCR